MARPLTPPPAFDDSMPWGTYRPSWPNALRLSLAHRMPPLLKQTALALRRPVKYGLDTPLDLEIRGLRLRLLPRGNISEEKLYTAPQLFDPDEFRIMEERLKPGGVFIDIGANAGIYSFHAARCMKDGGHILAVEPDAEMCRRIRFNIATNALATIDLVSVALSDHEGTAEFSVNPRQRGTNKLAAIGTDDHGDEAFVATVPVTTLFSLVAARGFSRIDVLKIDVEGHEYTVLRHFVASAPTALLPKIVIAEHGGHGTGETFALLEENGYRRRKTTRLNAIFERA
ncbi:FkbM family methyltransferase [Ensifer soli]|uniref:FkbM family methyltransferase n=1 Tax=Ciceribacter sp. sgz301302 TaxID=3342379 RepID=UPI0035B91409